MCADACCLVERTERSMAGFCNIVLSPLGTRSCWSKFPPKFGFLVFFVIGRTRIRDSRSPDGHRSRGDEVPICCVKEQNVLFGVMTTLLHNWRCSVQFYTVVDSLSVAALTIQYKPVAA